MQILCQAEEEEVSFNFVILSLRVRRQIMTTSALMKFLSVVRAGSVGPGVVGKPAILNNDGVPSLMEVVGRRQYYVSKK